MFFFCAIRIHLFIFVFNSGCFLAFSHSVSAWSYRGMLTNGRQQSGKGEAGDSICIFENGLENFESLTVTATGAFQSLEFHLFRSF
jgi:hypothetical protein